MRVDFHALIITADVHHIVSPLHRWDSPILAMPLVHVPGTAKYGSAYTAKKPLAKPEGDVVETSKGVAGEMGKRSAMKMSTKMGLMRMMIVVS
ncbi:unnamed protein product [Bubo scandiacus]